MPKPGKKGHGSMAESKLLQLTGLWLQDGKEGQRYMAGTLGNVKMYVFKNTRKTDAKQPDYYLSLGEKPKPEAGKDK